MWYEIIDDDGKIHSFGFASEKGNYLPSRSDKNIDVLNDPITPESHAEQAFLVACSD